VTVIIVSFNTKQLTLNAIETLLSTTTETAFRTVVWDNASDDGSASAIAERFPQVELIASDENLGFAEANNRLASEVDTEWILLLNPDTECHPGAVDNLVAFAKGHPQGGIWGGRTVFPDGSLNIASCWARITPCSAFCGAVGLRTAFPRSSLFNPEAYGSWQRNTVHEVDIVVGCFLLIRTELWNELEGFDRKYLMYGEEADLCLRARKLGWRPMITPDAEIMHLVGASTTGLSRKTILVAKARVTLIRDHWPSWQIPFGIALMWLWAALRYGASRPSKLVASARFAATSRKWSEVWEQRHDWLAGY